MLIVLLLTAYNSYSQIIPISIQERVYNSQLIIEGQVLEQRSFIDENNNVMTSNLVSLKKILFGNSNSTIEIITRGGTINGERVTWRNLINLSEGDKGIFFLVQSPYDSQFDSANVTFRVYASKQGFLQYSLDQSKVFSGYDNFITPEEACSAILAVSNSSTSIISTDDSATQLENTCLRYCLEIPIQPRSLGMIPFDIKVSSSIKNAVYQNFKLNFKYNSDIIGGNLVSSGLIAFDNIGISGDSNYEFIARDIDINTIEILCSSLSEVPQLVPTTEDKLLFTRIHISESIIGIIPLMEFDLEDLTVFNTYTDVVSGVSYNFDCIDFPPPTITSVCPEIKSIESQTPLDETDKLKVKSGDVLCIRGCNFGEEDGIVPPAGHTVLFTGAKDFMRPDDYFVRPEATLEYLMWTDTEIKVKIPAVAYDPTIPSPTLLLDNIAATGPIGIIADGCLTTSTEIVNVVSSTSIFVGVGPDGTIVSTDQVLTNRNCAGGYDLYYTEEFKSKSGGTEAFERALETWRCSTGVNFRIRSKEDIPDDKFDSACKIDCNSLPEGVTSAITETAAATPDEICVSEGELKYSEMKSFCLTFNRDCDWHTDETMPTLNWMNQKDLETIALHELGHAVGLNHSNNEMDLMYYKITNYIRSLDENTICGSMKVIENSTTFDESLCDDIHMDLVPEEDCSDLNSTQDLTDFTFTVVPTVTEHCVDIVMDNFSNKLNQVFFLLYDSNGGLIAKYDTSQRQICLDKFNSGIYILSINNKYAIKFVKI